MSSIIRNDNSTNYLIRSNTDPGATVSNNRVVQAIAWKDARQLLPLLLLLLGLEVLLHFQVTLSRDFGAVLSHSTVLLLIPALFSIGAGALLVSQDKELRSMDWLRSLPVEHSTILKTKWLVGFAGLAMCWLTSWLITLAFSVGRIETPNWFQSNSGFYYVLAPLNSIFLLILSIATAWKCRTALIGLIMIIPFAAIPTILSFLEIGLVQYMVRGDDTLSLPVQIGNYLVACLFALWFCWSSGMAYLTSRDRLLGHIAVAKYFDVRDWRTSTKGKASLGLVPSLVWQFVWQNRMIPIALIAIVVLPILVVGILSLTPKHFHGLLVWPGIIAWLIASWLGTSVFQSDSQERRIGFLAERGLAPGTIWWTRQFIPASVFACAAISFGIFMGLLHFQFSKEVSQGQPPILMYTGFGVPVVFAIYSVGQWYGQLFRSPIISLITVPGITALAIGYLGMAVYDFGSPVWLIFVSIAIGFLATRVLMSPWMDGRLGLRYWLGHSGLLLLATVLPLIPFFITVLSCPTMPSWAYREYQRQAAELGAYKASLLELSEPHSTNGSGLPEERETDEEVATSIRSPNDAKSSSLGQQIDARLDAYQSQLTSRPGPLRYSHAVDFVAAVSQLYSLSMQEQGVDANRIQRYRQVMQLLHIIVQRLRMSWRLVEQETADSLESWMLSQVQQPQSKERLGQTLYRDIVRSLANREGRKEARRRAILLSWNDISLSAGDRLTSLGGIEFQDTQVVSGIWRSQFAQSARRSHMVWLLLQYLDSQDEKEADLRFEILRKTGGFFGDRMDRAIGIHRGRSSMGTLWLGKWENDAQELGNRL